MEFQELGTDTNLYALVFGESVLNDAVCINFFLNFFAYIISTDAYVPLGSMVWQLRWLYPYTGDDLISKLFLLYVLHLFFSEIITVEYLMLSGLWCLYGRVLLPKTFSSSF
jgi:hypothetical protein